uniref:Uncharacterized protein n=1 Tax=Rousettus aegyptiacus TaxID=9407 RepID=A0A7J8CJ58_ROUAE|nr:hypothetical protein HJG63_009256 [Rousettus aegyptiacus]
MRNSISPYHPRRLRGWPVQKRPALGSTCRVGGQRGNQRSMRSGHLTQGLPGGRCWGGSEADRDRRGHLRQQHRARVVDQHGVPDRRVFCPDLDGQPPAVQQHDEAAHAQQQHGGLDLGAGHHLPQLQDRGGALGHHPQPAPQDLGRRQDPLHPTAHHQRRVPAAAAQLPHGRALLPADLLQLWLPQGRDGLQMEEKLGGGGGPEVLAALPV